MAVEARHVNLLQPQFLPNGDMTNPTEAKNSTTDMGMEIQVPFSIPNNLHFPLYYNNSAPLKNNMAVKSDNSGVTYTSRKRLRVHESMINPFVSATYNMPSNSQKQKHATNAIYFLGEDISYFVQNQQLDIERLISQHMVKLRYEVEEKRKAQAIKIMESMQVGVVKRLRVKEEEMQKIGKLNWALEERVKALCMENQIWRDMAQSNEATANALRANLEQVLAQVKDDGAATELDDAQSCCGSSGNNVVNEDRTWPNADHSYKRLCKNCFKDESCVLLLPCRHLCLCTKCGSSLHVCPVCKSLKNASVHVNMS